MSRRFTGSDRGSKDLTGTLLDYWFHTDGSGFSTVLGSNTGVTNHKRQLLTDYSQAAGTRGVWVVRDTSENGMLWRLNTPEMNTMSTGPVTFAITAPNGNQMVGTDTTAPFEYLWPAIPEGETKVTVVAVDDSGNESIPTAMTFNVVVPRDPYAGFEAEVYDGNNGFRSIGSTLGYLNSKGWTRYNAVDFGPNGPVSVSVFGYVVNGGSCDLRLGSTTGPIIATVSFSGTEPFEATINTDVDVTGIHDVFFTHRSGGPGVANVDRFVFTEAAPPPPLPNPTITQNGSNMEISFLTHVGYTYYLESTGTLPAVSWNPEGSMAGTGSEATMPVAMGSESRKIYRVRRVED